MEHLTEKQVDDSDFFELRSQVFEATSDRVQHLTIDQTAAYVDQDLAGDELLVVDDHLSHCEQCVLAVEDLRAFRNEIAPSLDREYKPASTESWWRRTFTSLTTPFRVAPVPAWTGAALAVVLLTVFGWLVWRTPQEPQIAVTPAPSPQPGIPQSQPSQPEPTPAQIAAQLNDGDNVLTLDQQGKLSGADQLPPAYQNMLKKALSGGRIERSSQLQGLTRPSSSLMGSNDPKGDFSVLAPTGNVLLTTNPTFRWSALKGATGYVVEVYDEKFMMVAVSPQLTSLSWTTTLPRGNVYSWQVKATNDGQEVLSPRPPAPQAKFRILDQAKANELAKALRTYGKSHLTIGLLYAEAGLLREAEEEFRALQKANPDSEVVRNLLRQVQSLRRQ
ncbi:MAG TPA: zf-HC2 domain-containing protein [Pyrinomonadaceae bacterium]|nr:zf-HC2 domain-containing protein [Pyrinomonadaceae bacterium]